MSVKADTYNRTGITGADAVPTSASPVVSAPGRSEIAWFLTANSETDVCTVRPWYQRGTDMHKGVAQSVTGSTVVMGYSLNGNVALQLTGVTGTWQVRASLVEKTA